MKAAYFLLFLLVAGCTLFGEQTQEADQPPSSRSQWAIAAKASSADGGLLGEQRDDQSPYAATGEPDVEQCGDSMRAWAPAVDTGLEWIELEYFDEVYVSQIRVRESWNPGAVVKVELKDSGTWHTVWEGTDTRRHPECPGYFVVNLEDTEGNITYQMTSYKSYMARITLDMDSRDEWNEIDAVELVGYDNKWYMYNDTLYIE